MLDVQKSAQLDRAPDGMSCSRRSPSSTTPSQMSESAKPALFVEKVAWWVEPRTNTTCCLRRRNAESLSAPNCREDDDDDDGPRVHRWHVGGTGEVGRGRYEGAERGWYEGGTRVAPKEPYRRSIIGQELAAGNRQG